MSKLRTQKSKNGLFCINEFMAYPSQIKIGLDKYCSQKCYHDSTKGKDTWSKGKIGIIRAPSTAFKKGFTSLNKGKKFPERSGEKSMFWKGGKPNCLDCGKKLSTYSCRRCRMCNLRNQFKSKMPTSIEKKVYDYLILKGIIFEKQKLINGRFVVDAYIPSLNLVVEADGGYWHNMDEIIKKDKAENAYLRKCGFKLLRLKEDEIKSDEFKERLVV